MLSGCPSDALPHRQISKAMRTNPSSIMYCDAGNAHKAQGNLDAAIENYHKALSLKPDYADAHKYLGDTLLTQGKLDAAVESYRHALSLKPDYAEAHNNLGVAFRTQGKLDAAVESYRRALSFKPDYAQAHNNLGVALGAQGKLDAAVESYRRALAFKSDYFQAHNNLGVALGTQGKLDAAIESYHRALSLKPDYAEAHNNLGIALAAQGKLDAAIESYRQALSLKPDYAEAHTNLAEIYIDLGKFDVAQVMLTKALESKPEYSFAWATLTKLRKMTLGDEAWLNTALRLVSPDNAVLSVKESMKLQFAIGKYYDDTQQHDLAFSAYKQAHALKRKIEGTIDRTKFSAHIDKLAAIHTAEFISQQREGASQSERPVLIVGMPRSGTTLIEQIIASHPQAFGAGELVFWASQTDEEIATLQADHPPALTTKLATAYEQLLQQLSADATRVVDKLPHNFLRLGLISAIFPRAKIIHVQRHPVDTCLSIYFQEFSSHHSYANDLNDLAFYYREYARLMHHWRRVLPADRFLEVSYEEIIDDQSRWSRRIIEFIGLDWDTRCLDFHQTERKVGTASNWQVRQKIYSTSKGRWHRYEKHIGPLRGLLDLAESNRS